MAKGGEVAQTWRRGRRPIRMSLYSRLITAAAWLAAAMFVLAGAMLTYEVVARYFFTAPTRWAAELSQYCLIWGSMLAMAWVLRERRHIAVSAGIALVGEGARKLADVVSLLFVLALSLIVAWHGFGIFEDSWSRGRTTGTMMNLPQWIVELAIPVGFAMLAAQCAIEMVRTWREGAPPIAGEHA